jgi:hypothetical protein
VEVDPRRATLYTAEAFNERLNGVHEQEDRMRIKAVMGPGVALVGALALATAPSAGAGASLANSQAAATKQVTAAFTTLFNAKATKSAREAELQNASGYNAAFTKLFSSSIAKSNPTAAQVTKVTYPSGAACKAAVKVSKCAKVTYNLSSANTGSSLLSAVTGYAVANKGHWLVSDTTFCSLAKLGGASC